MANGDDLWRRLRDDRSNVAGAQPTRSRTISAARRVVARRRLALLAITVAVISGLAVAGSAAKTLAHGTGRHTQETQRHKPLPSLSVHGPGHRVVVSTTSRGRVAFTITISRAPSRSVTVDFVTRNGSAHAGRDYGRVSRSITFPAGSAAAQTVTVNIRPDPLGGSKLRSFSAVLSRPIGATIDHAIAHVRLSLPVPLSVSVATTGPVTVAPAPCLPNDAVLRATLSRTSSVPVSLDWQTSGEPPGNSTQSGTVTISPGHTSATISIPISAPTDISSPFHLEVDLAATGAVLDPATTIVEQTVNPVAGLAIAGPATPADGSTATFTISLYGTLSSSISVLFSTGDGTSPTTDYTPVTDRPITFTSESKTTTQTTTVDLNEERKNTTNETFLGELGAPQGAVLCTADATAVIAPYRVVVD